jgi:hypothetical protein
MKKYQQWSARHAGPFIRDVFARFRRSLIDASQAVHELELSRARFYVLSSACLRVCVERRQQEWVSGRSGGNECRTCSSAVNTKS